MTVNAQRMLDDLAEAIHKARWPEDRQMDITPFADEDKNGRDYCFRIARAVAALPPSQEVPAPPQLVIRIKMDGGKGVVIARTPQEANQFIADVFNEKFGPTNAITMTIDYLTQADIPAAPLQCAREAIAKTIAAWMGYSWDGLPDYSVVNRSFPEWADIGTYQGGKPDLLRLADALMAHTRPDEVGREITDEMIERGARAHCPFAVEGDSTDWMRESARAEARNEVREILTAALSVPRPDERCRYCDEAIEPGHDCSVTRPERGPNSEAPGPEGV